MRLLSAIFCFLLWAEASYAFGPSLDDLYREMVSDDNAGSLPGFISNREGISFETPALEKEELPGDDGIQDDDVFKGARISAGKKKVAPPKKTKKRLQKTTTPERTWKQVILAVQQGAPDAFDLDMIHTRAAKNNLEAIELLAWMYANGVGIKQDLHKAWKMYVDGSRRGLKNASQNANAIYRAMSTQQRATLPPY